VGPERLVDDDAGVLHRFHRGVGASGTIRNAVVVGRLVVDEVPTGELATERVVRARVQDEGVPSDVDERRRAEVPLRLL